MTVAEPVNFVLIANEANPPPEPPKITNFLDNFLARASRN